MRLAIALTFALAAPAFADAASDAYVQRLVEGQRSIDRAESCRWLLAEQEQTGEIPEEARRRYGDRAEQSMSLCENLVRLDAIQAERD